MRGHLRPYDERGRVRAFYDIGPDPVTGRRRQRTKVLPDRAAGETFLEKIAADLELGVHTDEKRARTRVADFAETYLNARVDLERSTLVGYRSHLHNHVVPRIGARRLSDITPDLLSAMYGRMVTDGSTPALVKSVHRVVHGMFAHAVAWKYLADNPAARAITPKAEEYEADTWTADELAHFLGSTVDSRWYVGFVVSAATGMRRGEVCGLTWQAVNLNDNLISVQQTRLEEGGQIYDKPTPKSRHGRRTIPIDPVVSAVLAGESLRQRKERLRLGFWNGDYVVCNPDGGGVRPNSFTHAFKREVRRLGLPEVRLHDLRHTWGTLAIAGGADPKTVSKLLGHSTVAFTLDRYTHGTDAAERRATSIVGESVKRGVKRT